MRTYRVKVFYQSFEIDELIVEADDSFDAQCQAIDEVASQIEASAEADEDPEI